MIRLDDRHVQVTAGDTLYSISRAMSITATALVAANRMLPDPNVIKVGDVLHIPTSTLPAPTVETIDLVDYTVNNAGERFTTSRTGRGRDLTRYVLTKSTKTQTDALTGKTCPLFGQFAGHTAEQGQLAALTLQGYTLDLSAVPHNSHGIQVGYVKALTVKDFGVKGVRGTTSSPPGETFLFSAWHCGENGGRVDIDGMLLDGTINGAAIASSPFGLNDAWNVTARNVKAFGGVNGFGLAFWKGGGVNTFYDLDLRGNRKAINHEMPFPKSVFRYYRPNCTEQSGAAGGKPHVVINGSVIYPTEADLPVLEIFDPTWDDSFGPYRVGVQAPGTTYSVTGLPQTVRAEKVTVWHKGTPYTGPIPVSAGLPVAIGQVW